MDWKKQVPGGAVIHRKSREERAKVERGEAITYPLLKQKCTLYTSIVLEPLQEAMAKTSPTLGLAPEQQKQAELLPQLLKGHMLEYTDAVSKDRFDVYVSKTTGKTYKGGKVEREMEEIVETAEEWLALAKGAA